jgi:crossover junction endodeoxyribonuclease RuvC
VGQYSFQERLKRIFEGLSQIIAEYTPHVVVLEKIFVYKNVASTLKLGQARGVALVAVALSNLNVAEYTPRYIKKAVVGYGGADKKQVQQMIKTIFKLDGLPQVDAADALAIALCHAYYAGAVQ